MTASDPYTSSIIDFLENEINGSGSHDPTKPSEFEGLTWQVISPIDPPTEPPLAKDYYPKVGEEIVFVPVESNGKLRKIKISDESNTSNSTLKETIYYAFGNFALARMRVVDSTNKTYLVVLSEVMVDPKSGDKTMRSLPIFSTKEGLNARNWRCKEN